MNYRLIKGSHSCQKLSNTTCTLHQYKVLVYLFFYDELFCWQQYGSWEIGYRYLQPIRKKHEGIKCLSDRILNSQKRQPQLSERVSLFPVKTEPRVCMCGDWYEFSFFFLTELSLNSCRNNCILSIVASCQQLPLDSSIDWTIEKPFSISHHMTPNTCITINPENITVLQ